MTARLPAWVQRMLGALLSLVLLGGLLWWAHQQQADWSRVLDIPAAAWALLAASLMTSYLLRASRMHCELSANQPVGRWMVLQIALAHNAAVNLMPMRSGELAYPALLRRHLRIELAQSIPSLAWMRLQDLVVLGALALLLLPLLSWWAKLATLLTGTAMGYGLLRWLRRNPVKLPAFAAAFVDALLSAEKHSLATWVYCVGNWVVKLGGVGGFLWLATGTSASAALAGAMAGELSSLLPIQGPANLGAYEAAVWSAISLGSRTLSADLPAMILVMHAAMVLMAITLGLLAWLSIKTRHDTAIETH